MSSYAVHDKFGPIPGNEYRSIVQAMRAARTRAESWKRVLFVCGPACIWTVRPGRNVTKGPNIDAEGV